MSEHDILCFFNSEATLMLQKRDKGIRIETDQTQCGSLSFETPFCIHNPKYDPLYKNIYPFFEGLFNVPHCQGISKIEKPDIKRISPYQAFQIVGHGQEATLRVYNDPKNGLTGIQAKDKFHSDIRCPIVWINKAMDRETQNSMSALSSKPV